MSSLRLRPVQDGDLDQLFAIERDGILVVQIASFTIEDSREISYWIDPARWGQGLASAGLDMFLEIERTRPLHARVAEHNIASSRVLTRAGFVAIGSEASFGDLRARE